MSKWSDPNKYEWRGGDYCKKCWVEFVTLTPEEEKNLEDRARVFKAIKKTVDLYT